MARLIDKVGDVLKLLLSSVIGMILLIPILYFVPLQLNRKLKFSLIVSSFVLAVLGSLAYPFLSLINTIFILVLLALLCAYFIGKRAVHSDTVDLHPKRMDLSPSSLKSEPNQTEPIKIEPTLPPAPVKEELDDTPVSLNTEPPLEKVEEIVETKQLPTEIKQEEVIDSARDSLPEIEPEDDFVLSEIPQRMVNPEDIASVQETSEEELLKERNLLFEVLDEDFSLDQEEEMDLSAKKDPTLENIDKG